MTEASMGKLDGRVAIVTGGARGQGAAEAALLRDEGADVVITDVRRDQGATTAAQIGATFMAHDVADERAWAGVVDHVTTRFGRVDVLVNNAGVLHHAGGLLDTDEAGDRHVIDVNQIGVFLGMRAVAPVMIGQTVRDDHQHLLRRRSARIPRRLRLRRIEVRRARDDQIARHWNSPHMGSE
jgi:3alpha(or 20beta)-hydroxysteroid dehydrogenase